jgi:hypothetical protein
MFIFQVVDWILGPGEKLLASQSDIGDSFEAAEALRKRHEELEIKCTVSCDIYMMHHVKIGLTAYTCEQYRPRSAAHLHSPSRSTLFVIQLFNHSKHI